MAGGDKQVYSGQYIGFTNHRKVYMVRSADAAYGSSQRDLTVYPNLVEDVARNTDRIVLLPNLWCVYTPGLTFGSQTFNGDTVYYAGFNVSEYLE